VKGVLEESSRRRRSSTSSRLYRELSPTRRAERNDLYTRNLLSPAGKIERLEVSRDREGEFSSPSSSSATSV